LQGTLEDMVDHTVGRALDLFDIDVGLAHRWGDQADSRRRPAAKPQT
jgi:4-hydroxy-3-polyprenylbenzoate decarboxylase